MKRISLDLPENLDLNRQDIAMLVASRLYEQGKVTLGEGAAMVGLTKRTFIELLGQYNVSIFNHEASDLARDIENA